MPSLTVSTFENDITNVESLAYAILQANNGLIDSIIISSSLNGGTINLSALTSLNGTSEESLTTITVDYGTVTGLSGSLSATGGSAYGVKSSSGTLSINGFTGTVTATASTGEAAGFSSVFGGGVGGTGELSFSGLSGDISAVSDAGDAFGIISRHTGNYNYGYNNLASSTVTADGLSSNITVTAAGLAAGVYSLARQTGYNPSTASSTVSLGDVTGHITVTGGTAAYGIYSGAYDSHNNSASLAIGDMTGEISVSASDGPAYGLFSSGSLQTGVLSGTLSASSENGDAWLLRADGDVTIEDITDEFSATVTAGSGKTATGFSAGGALAVSVWDISFEVSVEGDCNTTILQGGTVAIDSFIGSLSASSESGTATALEAVSGGTLKTFEGTITATGGSAYGVKSSTGTVSIDGFTGTVTATASTGEAAGFSSVYEWGVGGTGELSFSGLSGDITAVSDAGDAFGILSRHTGNNNFGYNQQAISTVATDGLSGNITVTAAGLAAGIYSLTSQRGYNPSTASSTVSLGDVTGHITVTGGTAAYGIHSAAYNSHNNSASLVIGDMTGEISASASDGPAYGLFSSGSLHTGVLSGTLSASAENSDAWLVRADGDATIDEFAEEFSATVTAGSNKTATGFSAGNTLAIDSIAGSLAASSESGKATVLEAVKGGTLKDVKGTITATGGSAYGVKSSSGTLSINGFTGTVTATASTGEAAGFSSVFDGGVGGTGELSFSGLSGDITAVSDAGDAFGILSRHTGNNNFGYNQQAISTVATDGLSGNITVTAAGLAAGIYSLTSQRGYNPSTASSTVFLGNVTGHITVTGGTAAYGIYSAAYDSHNNSASLVIGDMTGEISVSSSNGDTYGLFSSGSLQTGVLSGTLSVSSENGNAWLVRADGDATIDGFTNEFSATVTAGSNKTATGFSAGGALAIPVWDISFEVSAEGNCNATALYGGTVAIDSFTDSLSASSESGKATAMEAVNGGTLKDVEGTITATGNSAYGVKSSSETLSVDGFTGVITATASTGEAAGFSNVYEAGIGGTGELSFTGLSGDIIAVSVKGDAYGILSRRTGTNPYNYNQQAISTVAADGLSGNITVTAAGLAAGVYSRASQRGYNPSTASSTVSFGDVTGHITVTGGTAAYGLYSGAYDSHNNSASLTIGDMTGGISVSASNGDAYGLYSRGSLQTGVLSGTLSASSENGNAWLVRSDGDVTIDGFAPGFSATVTAGSGKTATGFSAGGALAIPVWDISLDLSVAGNCNVTALQGGTVAIDSFTGSLSASSESGNATVLEAVNGGTLKDVEGTITTTGGNAYGVKSSSGTLSVDGFTGTVTATASTGEAAGFANVYSSAEGGTGGYSFKGFTGSVTVSSDAGNAYGILSSRTGRSYSYYLKAVSTVAVDGLAGHITVTAAGLAAGVYSRASQIGYNPATATSDVSLGDVDGHITVTGGTAAYGIYSGAYDSHNNTSTLVIGDMTGEIAVSASDGDAYGMFTNGSLQTGVLSGTLSASSENGNAWLIRADGDATIDGFTDEFSATVTAGSGKTATGFSAGGALAIPEWDISLDMSVAGDCNVTILQGGTTTINSFTGSLSASSESGKATALEATNGGTLKTFEGTITTSGGNTYGVKSSSGTLSVDGFTGTVTATASTGEAAGFSILFEGDIGGDGELSFNGLSGDITAVSDAGDAFGILSRRSGTNPYSYYQQTLSTVTADSMSAHITVTAAGLAAGVYSRASQRGYYGTGSATVSFGDVDGYIAVTGGTAAYGLYSGAYGSTTNTASLTVGNITGEMTVKATGGDAYGLFSSGDLTLNGDITGDISITAETGVAVFVSAYNTITYNDEEAATVSGNIIVNGANGAYGFLASGNSHLRITGLLAVGNFQSVGWMPLPLARKYSIYSDMPADLAKIGYAYADGTLNGGSLVMGSSDDDLAIADGAQVIGKIALGGGDNALAIDGGAQIIGDITADTLDLAFNLSTPQSGPVITAAAAGALGSANTTWTINLDDDIRSGRYVLATVEDGLDAEAMANLTVTVNVFDETHEITFADDMDKLGVMDINVTEFGEIEFVYADTFFGIRHNIRNSAITAENNGAITLYFSRKLDAASFDVDMITLTDGEGNAVAITGYEIDGAALHLEFDPIAVSGDCTLTVSSRLKDVDGNRLDQNVDKVGGGADDAFTVELTADGDVSGLPVGKPEDLHGTADGLSWTKAKYARQYLVVYSPDNYRHTLEVAVPTNGLDTFGLPTATYQWRVLAVGNYEWVNGEDFATKAAAATPQLVQPEANGLTDLIFVSVHGTWGSSYQAVHVGGGEWTGTEQTVQLAGKNLIDGVYVGGDDASLLLLTDDDNGDALFMDDIYSAFPEGVDVQARVAKIDEIRAGAGNDIIDLTSQQFDYVGDGMIVRGGLGDDVIWANKGQNYLFGDAGDDCIVGGAGNDVIIGGSGDDTLHGGGSDDIFAFGYDWGQDTVEQLAGGKVTLWFAYGDASKWDDGSLTYTDGDRSVSVSGVALEDVTLKFGDDGTEQYELLQMAGAFDDSAHAQIFEDNTRGMLA